MRFRRLQLVSAAVLLFSGAVYAQEITGNWQGTVDVGRKLRVVLQIERKDDGGLRGNLYSIDQGPDPMTLNSVSFVAPTLKFTVDPIHISFEGTLGASGTTITGTITQGRSMPLVLERATKETAWKTDASPQRVQMVPVDKDVKLEVLDWGGTGRPLVLLTGLGDTAHVFDQFATKLTAKYHVYGITRRGFGASSAPEFISSNYSADRLGEDVVAVIDALHLDKPVVAGHSIAGEELSYIGSHDPEKVAGLIYLDAGYPYALYDKENGDVRIDVLELRAQLGQIAASNPLQTSEAADGVLANLHRVEKELEQSKQDMKGVPAPASDDKMPALGVAILDGMERFDTIHAPALVIFAVPKNLGGLMKNDPKARAAIQASTDRDAERQAKAFERQVPSAHVVRIANANHYVFRSNEADVIREMEAFISTLPAS